MTTPVRQRLVLFAAASVVAVAAVVAYVVVTSKPHASPASEVTAPPAVETIAEMPAGPILVFRDTSPGPGFGRLAALRVPVVAGAPRLVTPLSCERAHYAAGRGVCMVADETRMPIRYAAYTFDRTFAKSAAIALTGLPIRARVSPDGRRAVVTVFERGHSYAEEGFSTRTTIVDAASGRPIGDLEQFSVEKDGRTIKSIDFNFWGVTFQSDGDRFFATLQTKGHKYLVHGSVDARHMSVMRDEVECPSLSPDGTLVAFKKPLKGELGWRLHVLDLASGVERPLNQVQRSVDDQVEWFDAAHVMYHDSASDGTGIWVLPVDGVGPPALLLASAYSPAVQR